MTGDAGYGRRVEPAAAGHRHAAWDIGAFDTGHRERTARVEGAIHLPGHLVLATLHGGARRLRVESDCGHRYDGAERAGVVSFVPARCGRRLWLDDVAARWASFSLSPGLFDGDDGSGGLPALPARASTNIDDAFVVQLLATCARAIDVDGGLDPLYGEAMTLALAHHLVAASRWSPTQAGALPRWRLRRVEDRVEAGLGGSLRIADLAADAGLSVGHFHRAFLATTGRTPLAWITARRIARAESLMRGTHWSLLEIAAAVGFASPGQFARVFRRAHGKSPAEWRRMCGPAVRGRSEAG